MPAPSKVEVWIVPHPALCMKNIRLRSYKDTGTILVADGLITAERLAEAADVQQRAGVSVGRALVELGFISEWELARAVGRELAER